MSTEAQPIIVKKIKKHGHGHHGGAWKVAYADFVTAMMAFFLLMWLMGNTTEGQRGAIADYFQNPSAIQNGEGGATSSIIDMGGGSSMSKDSSAERPDVPTVELQPTAPSAAQLEEVQREQEQTQLAFVMEELSEAIQSSRTLKASEDQLLLDVMNEGLRIQIVDKAKRPMFDVGSADLRFYAKEILHELDKFIQSMPNKISITGHTDARVYGRGSVYTNWELSADRANASRRELIAGGLSEAKIIRVVGLASAVPLDKEDPYSPTNRRISIIILNKIAERSILGEGGQSIEISDADQLTKDRIKTNRQNTGSPNKRATSTDSTRPPDKWQEKPMRQLDKINLPELPKLPGQ